MDTLSLSFRRSSAPELNKRLPKRSTLERKLSCPGSLGKSDTIPCIYDHQFEKCIGVQLPDIFTIKQQRMAGSAWIGDTTRSCKDDEPVKLDIIVSKRQFGEGGNPSKSGIRKTKLSVDFQSRYKVTDRVCTALPSASSRYQQKSKDIQRFIDNSEKGYDIHKEKAILLQNWIVSQRIE